MLDEHLDTTMNILGISFERQAFSTPWIACLVPIMAVGLAGPVLAAIEPSGLPPDTFTTGKSGVINPKRAASAPSASVKPVGKPSWQELTPAQQLSLKPLAANWGNLSQGQKRKWIAISAGYPKLSAAEQAMMHSRMTEWAGLSQSQRAQARLNFADTKQVATSQKAANWQAYQALSPDEKKKLVSAGPAAPTGAAATAKPVQPKRLASVPVTRPDLKQGPKMAAATHPVDPNTLLPLVDSATTHRN